MNNNNNKIISLSEYQKLLTKINQLNEQAAKESSEIDTEACLKTYNELLKLRDKGFPLLLQEGEAFVFDTPPRQYLFITAPATHHRAMAAGFFCYRRYQILGADTELAKR